MKTQFTPGPWRVDHSGNCHIGIIDENERTIAFCALQNENSEEDESNSCLIASAPELLAALEFVSGVLSQPVFRNDSTGSVAASIMRDDAKLVLNHIGKIIAKAKGLANDE